MKPALSAREKKLIDALLWYADPKSWHAVGADPRIRTRVGGSDREDLAVVGSDGRAVAAQVGGRRAREALKGE